ncbi:MAG: patatin-like phospholipase family protein [Rhodomicrobium sp.]
MGAFGHQPAVYASYAIAAMAPVPAFSQAAQRIKRAFAFGGGSIKGAYQAGVIKVLLDKGFIPDYLYGISAGSLSEVNGDTIVRCKRSESSRRLAFHR